MTRAELERDREEIEEARKAAAAAQREFWDAMSDLESAMGFNVDLDDNKDLEDVTVDDLIEEHAEKCFFDGCGEEATRWCEVCGSGACPAHSIKTDEVTQCDSCRAV